MGPNELYWRTNTSFSPPPSRWDYTLQSEGLQYGSSDSIQLFGSASTNSKESRNWIRGGYHPTHHYSTSDGSALYFSSPSDASLVQPWTPPPVRGVSIDEFVPSHRRGVYYLSLMNHVLPFLLTFCDGYSIFGFFCLS